MEKEKKASNTKFVRSKDFKLYSLPFFFCYILRLFIYMKFVIDSPENCVFVLFTKGTSVL